MNSKYFFSVNVITGLVSEFCPKKMIYEKELHPKNNR